MYTFQEARELTNPDAPDEQRDAAAQQILLGQRANAMYWDSRGELEALRAQAAGHGVVVRGDTEDTPTAVGTPTDAPAIEGTSTEEPTTALDAGGAGNAADASGVTDAQTVPPTPDNPTEAVARLRKQLADAGMTPEA